MTPEANAIIDATNKWFGAGGNNSNKLPDSRYESLENLFDPDNLLELITELDKDKIETLTRHDTLAVSMQQLGHLKDKQAEPFMKLKDTMQDRYMMYQISKSRKARKEVVDVLKEGIEQTVRNIGDKLKGRA